MFFGGVWASVIIGLFFVAMVIGCTFDRHYNESPKWWVIFLGMVALLVWQWDNVTFSWSGLFSATIWMPVLYYVLIGLGYSVLEFVLEVRRSARYWRNTWNSYKKAWSERGSAMAREARERQSRFNKHAEVEPAEDSTAITSAIAGEFMDRYSHERNYSKRVVGIEKVEGGGIEAKVNRVQLAESIGCWTIFWPFYLISLIIGDLATELFNIAADFLASISGRFVRMTFKDVFKF